MTTIPTPVGPIYEELKTEVMWLHARWISYRQLFCGSEARIQVLNECAPVLFFIVHDVLLDEFQVCLSKLTDPAKSGTCDNLSLQQLQALLETHAGDGLPAQTELILNRLRLSCASFRIRRNKKLAHNDLNTSMRVTPLPVVSRQMIAEALSLVRQFMNTIEAHYNDNEVGYDGTLLVGDGDALVALLRQGLRYRELLNEELIPSSDWEHLKWKDA